MRLSFNHVIKEPWSSTKGLFNARKIREKKFLCTKIYWYKAEVCCNNKIFPLAEVKGKLMPVIYYKQHYIPAYRGNTKFYTHTTSHIYRF